MPYTLGEAAKATGKSKAAISEAIAAHRLSAVKDELGRWRIEPAELHRLYPPTGRPEPPPNTTEHPPDPGRAAEVAGLEATVAGLERLCRQLESERDSLREQNLRLTALLPPPPAPPPPRRWWRRRRA